MSIERRNHYRILFVQPEAPQEIIAAAYRCLMTTLKRHPDLGGNHEMAVRINVAYATLSDPEKRRAYDLELQQSRRHRTRVQPPTVPEPEPEKGAPCAFCGKLGPRILAADSRCERCNAPLAPVPNPLRNRKAAATAPAVGRKERRELRSWPATIHTCLDQPTTTARLRDLSPSGISLYTAEKIALGNTIRIVTEQMDVVARVVGVRPHDRIRVVHARLLTACFLNRTGLFVATVL